MKSIWYFGDSFAEQRGSSHTWTLQVAQQLNYRYQNFAFGGTGIEYTYEKFEEQSSNFQDGDIVIVAVTSLNRTYFDECIWMATVDAYRIRWERAVAGTFIKSVGWEYQKYMAYSMYVEHLHKESNYHNGFINFLYRLEHESATKNLKTVVFSCFGYEIDQAVLNRFKHIYCVSDALNNISRDEFDPPELYRKHCDKHGDLRVNHMSEVNHNILAGSVVKYLTGVDDSIDLTVGYHQKIYNESNHTIINNIC